MNQHQLNLSEKSIDIICPVYNKQDYIEAFIKSVSLLPAHHFNIILINDGSTDNTLQVCERVLSERVLPNVYIVTQPNGGVSAARNTGLDLACSRYVWFCDPDDEVLPEAATLPDFIENKPGLVFSFSHDRFYVGTQRRVKVMHETDECLSGEAYLKNYNSFGRKNDITYLWNKIYSREAIGQLRFQNGMTYGEDNVFNVHFIKRNLLRNDSFYISTMPIYLYNKYAEGTLSTSLDENKIADLIEAEFAMLLLIAIVKKNIIPEKKRSIYKVTKVIGNKNQRAAKKYYFQAHKELNLRLFPFTGLAEAVYFVCMLTMTVPLMNKALKSAGKL